MISLRELLQQIVTERGMTAAAHQAKSVGLVRKPGFGNWGPPNSKLITRRTIKGHLKSVPPHRVGKKSSMTGQPKPNMQLINRKGVPTKAKPPVIKFPLWRNKY
jgi:hypothetical protein